MATWNSRGLRGSTLEDMINKTNVSDDSIVSICNSINMIYKK